MGRLFCYTLSARAIGATVSAGALHAQGWGFESLIAHHRIVRPPAMEAFPFSGPAHGIRTRQHVCHKGRGQKMAKMSTATLLTTYKKIAFTYVTQHVSIIRTNSWLKIVLSSPFRLAIWPY